LPVLKGLKSEAEKFAGAENTYCIEALMQDGKALQAGTSHFLGQNFAKAFDVKFLNKENKLDHVWATSWGVSTRLMGALIMAHSDDNGLIIPPKLAPVQVVIVPIFKTDDEFSTIDIKAKEIIKKLIEKGIRVKYDNRDTHKPGYKFAEHEFKGVPLRFGIGPKDIANNTVEVARRDTMQKEFITIEEAIEKTPLLLSEIQQSIYNKALLFRKENTYYIDDYEQFKKQLDNGGGFIYAHWDGTAETELRIKEETMATIRFIPNDEKEPGQCIYSGKPSSQRVVFARSY
ncbi:MAG: His/Gly/Thr/Pro-type tRNA ligase C-terminal domain-containing protein, partial [Bacteroidales bacterium]|nr:His/Gly/Thr/Pro-type tRNA ligase C-terminal domain-containing protein [Bacteroidales bacterium]